MNPVLVFIIGLASGLVAFWIGKWRRTCLFWHLSPYRLNTPPGWRDPFIRNGSLLAVMVLSVVFASCWAFLIMVWVNKWIGEFSWGMLLAARWTASGFFAEREFRKNLVRFNLQVRNPDIEMFLATGKMPDPAFKELKQRYREGKVSIRVSVPAAVSLCEHDPRIHWLMKSNYETAKWGGVMLLVVGPISVFLFPWYWGVLEFACAFPTFLIARSLATRHVIATLLNDESLFNELSANKAVIVSEQEPGKAARAY